MKEAELLVEMTAVHVVKKGRSTLETAEAVNTVRVSKRCRKHRFGVGDGVWKSLDGTRRQDAEQWKRMIVFEKQCHFVNLLEICATCILVLG